MAQGQWVASGVMLGLVLTGLVSGCVSTRGSGETRAPLPLPTHLAAYYRYTPIDQPAVVCIKHEQPRYVVRKVTLTPPGAPDQPIQLLWFAPRSTEPGPLILISPIKGSDTLVSAGFAELFAARGYHAAIVKRPDFDFVPSGPLTQIETILRSAVIRNRQALDWMLAQPEIDPQRVGSLGISYGGIVNAALAGVEPRIQAHVFDLAGAPVAKVMRTSVEGSLRRAWQRARNHHGLTNRALYRELREVIRTDPVRLAPHVPRDRVRMVIALFDRSVDTRAQLELWEALGRPEATFVPLGHYTSILALPFHRQAVMRFFEDRFELGRSPLDVALGDRDAAADAERFGGHP